MLQNNDFIVIRKNDRSKDDRIQIRESRISDQLSTTSFSSKTNENYPIWLSIFNELNLKETRKFVIYQSFISYQSI